MEGFIFRKGFIQGVHMYLWRDSYKEFTYIYGGIHMKGEIHIRSSHLSVEGFIKGVHIYLWRDSYIERNS